MIRAIERVDETKKVMKVVYTVNQGVKAFKLALASLKVTKQLSASMFVTC